MISALAHILPKFKGQEAHIWCFAHVLNLVVKVIDTCNLFVLYMSELFDTGYSIPIFSDTPSQCG
jgi:hypothetical protein